MPVKNELEILGDGELERVSGYTLSHNDSSLAMSLNLTIERDMNRPFIEYEANDEINLTLLGRNETFRVTDTETNGFSQTVFLLSKEIETVYKVSTKELRFMSMNANERADFQTYLGQDGSDIVNLDYTPYLAEFNYLFYKDRPTEIEGGWWAYGDESGNSIMDILGDMLGINVKCALPPYRVRQFSVPKGSSIYMAMMELVSGLNPTVFFKHNTLYILEPNSTDNANILRINTAANVAERKLYKELSDPEDIIFEGGPCLFDPDLYEGPIFPERIPVNIPIAAVVTGPEGDITHDLGSLDVVSFGSYPEPEVTISNLESPGYGVTKATETMHFSVWDIFHSRPIRFHTISTNWAFNNMSGVIEPISEREELIRYNYLDPCFASPRIDSGLILDVYSLLKTTGEIPDEIRTLQNWSRLTRTGALQWKWVPEKNDYQYMIEPNSEFEFEWTFYDKYGRLALRARRIYADVHTTHFVPLDYVEYSARQTRTIPWKRASAIKYDGQLSGTVIKVLPTTEASPAFDPRTIVSDIVETFTPTGKGMYRVEKRERYLDDSVDRFKSSITSEEVPKGSLDKQAIMPKEMNLVLDPKARKAGEILDRPVQRLSNPNVWVREEGLTIFEYMKKHIAPIEIERSMVLPYSLYIPKGSVIYMGEIEDFKGRTLLPDRNIFGRVVAYSCSKSGATSSTQISIKGNSNAS